MRIKKGMQGVLGSTRAAPLAITVEHFAKYELIDQVLTSCPRILELVHKDLAKALEKENRKRDRKCKFTSSNVLRITIAKSIEAESFRGICIRIDDSAALRRFVGINNAEMMDFTLLNKLVNKISPKTWKKLNDELGMYAFSEALISPEKLRLDTTAIESNIHYPTDSSLLADVYRVLARYIEHARDLYPEVVGDRRLLRKKVKKLARDIGRASARKGTQIEKLKPLYEELIRLVDGILEWSTDVASALESLWCSRAKLAICGISDRLTSELRHYTELGRRVADQARRRVLEDEPVPNDEKLFSIFEPHTELLKRGKAGKPIEFGHMILLQQVEGCFITGYDVFEKKPVEHELVMPVIDHHTVLFGAPPKVITADKGFYETMDRIHELEKNIELVAIPKKGKRSAEEDTRESDPLFKIAQQFRAGVEGSISFLKRCFRLLRCFNKGFVHFAATVGMTVFAHNLVVLARNTS